MVIYYVNYIQSARNVHDGVCQRFAAICRGLKVLGCEIIAKLLGV